MSAGAKRTFLFRTFQSLGPHVCESLGLPGASADVDIAEWNNAMNRLAMTPDAVVTQVIERARWVVEAIASDEWLVPIDVIGEIGKGTVECPDCGEEATAVTLQEILVKFYMAMRLEEIDGHLVR